MTSEKKQQRFTMEVTVDDNGNVKTQTNRKGMPYETVVSALSQQLYLYNKLWAEEASFVAK